MRFLYRIWDVVKSPSAMAILAVVGFALAIYQGFIYEKRGQLNITIDALSRVFDVHQPIGGLDISYDGENLRSAKKTLWAMTFSVRNSGNAEIRKGDYDESAPLGFQISGAEIVDHPTIKTNTEYLSQNLKIKKDKDRLTLSPVVFEPDDFIQINVLLLGPETAKPTVSALGKIAGIKHVNVTTLEGNHTGKSTWQMVTTAEALWVHPLRTIVYGLGSMIALALLGGLIAAILTPFEKFSSKKAIHERRGLISKYRPNQNLDRETRFLAETYVEKGLPPLFQAVKFVHDIKRRIETVELLSAKLDEATVNDFAKKITPFTHRDTGLITQLGEAGLLTFDGAMPRLSTNFEKSLMDLCNYLSIDSEAILQAELLAASSTEHKTE